MYKDRSSTKMTYQERLKERAFFVGREDLRQNEIPSVCVWGETLPEAWEVAVLATLEFGASIPTEYDQEIDPESKDVSMMLTIARPLEEPRIHKALPCGLDDLEIYVQEVVGGVHDSWVKDKGWSYSYHDRLYNWPGIGSEFELTQIDQIDALVRKLSATPHSRRAQAITWAPFVDAQHHEPPCLQRIWCRVVKSEKDLYLLQMNTHWRSRDAFKAAFMNMYAFIELQKKMAEEISKISGKRVEVGRYVDISDSFHIYGSYLRKGETDRFLAAVEKRSFANRVWRSDNSMVQEQFERGKKKLNEEKHLIENGKKISYQERLKREGKVDLERFAEVVRETRELGARVVEEVIEKKDVETLVSKARKELEANDMLVDPGPLCISTAITDIFAFEGGSWSNANNQIVRKAEEKGIKPLQSFDTSMRHKALSCLSQMIEERGEE